jgi:hypothetical protein
METGLIGEFEDADKMLAAIRELRKRGWRRMDAFTPYPVKGIDEALALPRSNLNWKVLPFAVLGTLGGYVLQWFCNGFDYPLNVGGRPPHSAPAFIPITFETGVLSAAIFGVLVFGHITRLPRLYRPLFDVPELARATLDRFFIGLDAADPSFSLIQGEQDLREVGATQVLVARRREEP